MDVKLLVVVAALTVVIYMPSSQAKPISLVERCYCRTTVNRVPRSFIRDLKFIHTPNCPFQVVCLNPETGWLHHYLKNAIGRKKQSRNGN
uniref:Uncharacterized protein n=1 Tax=Monopterus albus TaxID=43700 RepID=A0A3Q3QYT3_MONAL